MLPVKHPTTLSAHNLPLLPFCGKTSPRVFFPQFLSHQIFEMAKIVSVRDLPSLPALDLARSRQPLCQGHFWEFCFNSVPLLKPTNKSSCNKGTHMRGQHRVLTAALRAFCISPALCLLLDAASGACKMSPLPRLALLPAAHDSKVQSREEKKYS